MRAYHRASQTLNDMVQDRGYQPLPYANHLPTFEVFQSWLESKSVHEDDAIKLLLDTKVKHQTLKKWLFIQWVAGPTLNTNLRDIYIQFLHQKVKRVILVYDVNVTAKAMSNVRNIADIDLTLYHRDELQFNITKHQLQPKFTVCTEDQKQEILTMYAAEPHQFPAMTFDDPIRRYYGVPRGTLFEILKTTADGQQRLSYRIVE